MQALISPGCPSPPPLVACPPLPPVACPPPPRFCRKGVCMCHHWHAALPRFTPLPSLHPLWLAHSPPLFHPPPQFAPPAPCWCTPTALFTQKGHLHATPFSRGPSPHWHASPVGARPSTFHAPSPHFTPPLLLASAGPPLTHVPLSPCPLY